jgi:rhodanese-related sulfurtransferase
MSSANTPRFRASLFALATLLTATAVAAAERTRDVGITDFLPEVRFSANGKNYVVDRVQDTANEIRGGFAQTSRKCPPFCIHPMEAAPGVVTVGEIELLEFLKNKVEKGAGLLIDARVESFYAKGTIPGSTHIPFTSFTADEKDPTLQDALRRLGVARGENVNWSDTAHRTLDGFGQSEHRLRYDFSRAREIMLFCNGPWCDQSPRAIKALVKLGYPVNKMFYYRGGMQDWLMLGLSVEVPPAKVTPASSRTTR